MTLGVAPTRCNVYDEDMETTVETTLEDIIDVERPEAPPHIRDEAWAWDAGFEAGFRAAAERMARSFNQAIDAAPSADDRLIALMTIPVICPVIDQDADR